MDGMNAAAGNGLMTYDIFGTEVQVFSGGSGPTVLFIQSALWLGDDSVFVGELAKRARVIAPLLPGIGIGRDRNKVESVDDLAYLFLDLIGQLRLRDVILVGASFGGWVGAEMAVRDCSAISRLVLVDALGVKIGPREHRDIADVFGLPDEELLRRCFADPSRAGGDLRSLPDGELRMRLRARETLARYGWQPYMHNPRLRTRLHRIVAPTLFLWGDRDGVAAPDYGRAYAAMFPNARFEIVANAGHLAHIEHPATIADHVMRFATTN